VATAATGELGVAVQSHWFAVGPIVPWAEAGVGAVATQSFVDPSYGKNGLDLMRAGKSAPDTLKELLATPNEIRITTPTLPRESLERVLEIIRRDVAADKVSIDTPTQNLESYFLDVVRKARQSAAETSGAMSGARVAEYLRGGAEGQPADRFLERLAQPQSEAPAPGPAAAKAETVDQKKLDALTRPEEPVTSAPKSSAESPRPADLAKADEKLSSLLNKPKE
jgi:hypothetical protein